MFVTCLYRLIIRHVFCVYVFWWIAGWKRMVLVACPRSVASDAQTHVIKACRHINLALASPPLLPPSSSRICNSSVCILFRFL